MEITDALLAKLRDKYYGRLSYVHLNPDSKQGLVDLIQEEKDLEPQFVNDRPRELVQALAFYKNKKAKLELCFRSRSTGAYVAVTKDFTHKVKAKSGKVDPAGQQKIAYYAILLLCPLEQQGEYHGFARKIAKEYTKRRQSAEANGFQIQASEIDEGEVLELDFEDDDLEVVDADVVGMEEIPRPTESKEINHEELFGDVEALSDADVHFDDDSLADLGLGGAEAEFMRSRPGKAVKKRPSQILKEITSARKPKK